MPEPSSHHIQTTSRRWQPASSVSPRQAVEGTALAVLGLVATAAWAAAPLAAQGVTGAAIDGRVLSVDSTPVEQATVHVVNASNGERWRTTTTARGRYFIEYLSVGGPYRIEVRAVGYVPAQRESIVLALGQRLTADFELRPAVVQLQEITVTGTTDPRFSAARTGPAQIISGSTISRLPVDGRDYTELARLSPQVTVSPNGGLSFSGQHDRFNSIQIDGTNNNDLFGSSASGIGTPGWAVGLRAFTPEAVKELQIITAPFDVRYGNFAGGLINAVTRSGSNRVEGSLLGYLEGTDLSGTDSTGSRGADFNRKEFGLTLGAPIVQDRVALFLNVALRRQVFPQAVPAPSSDTTGGADSVGVGIRYESLVRFQDILRDHGVEPGTFSAGTTSAPSRNLFAKVTAQLGVNSRLEVSHNYGHGNDRQETGERDYGVYSLSSHGSENPETVNATRVAWTAVFGSRFSNELVLARVDDRRTCLPNSRFPFVEVEADDGFMYAGMPELVPGARNRTDDLGNHRQLRDGGGEPPAHLRDTWRADRPGRQRAGISGRFLGLPRSRLAGARRGVPLQPDHRHRRLPGCVQRQADRRLPPGSVDADAAAYVDRRTPPRRTVPARAPHPESTGSARPGDQHRAYAERQSAVVTSPRRELRPVGPGHDRLAWRPGPLRGPPAYQWFRNGYARTGAVTSAIECEGEDVPAFTLDPANQPEDVPDRRPIQSVASTTSIRSSGSHGTSSWLPVRIFSFPGES